MGVEGFARCALQKAASECQGARRLFYQDGRLVICFLSLIVLR
jgi:hypothetical protein